MIACLQKLVGYTLTEKQIDAILDFLIRSYKD
jgi:hypothetical protein